MSRNIEALQRAAKAFVAKPFVRFTVGDISVICSQCRGDRFYLSTPSIRKIAGYSLECARCSHLEYFQKRPTERDDQT